MNEQQPPRDISRREAIRDILVFVAGALTGAASLKGIDMLASEQDLPQGFWESAVIEGNRLVASINAYTNDPHIGIERVDVTVKDPEGHWHTVCRLTVANLTNSFVCDQEIADFIDGNNPVEVSFNVVSTTGKVSFAPNGVINLVPQ